MAGPSDTSAFRDAVIASADRLGISPSDLLTVISYETGGRMSPSIMGGAGGRHMGLIQFGPEEARRYGARPDQNAAQQMVAVEAYLRDRGVKPGHGLLDIYSTINAGRPGLYSRSDAANGGAPGTVADKVATMAGHRMRANAILGITGDAASPTQRTVAAAGGSGSIPLSLAPSGGEADADQSVTDSLAGLAAIPAALQRQEIEPMRLPAIRYASPKGLAKARALAQAMSNYSLG